MKQRRRYHALLLVFLASILSSVAKRLNVKGMKQQMQQMEMGGMDMAGMDMGGMGMMGMPGMGGTMRATPHDVDHRRVVDNDPSFFDLEAKDINGKTIDFERFYGYVTVVVNVPTDCESGDAPRIFEELVELRKVFPYGLEILAFPNNQFGEGDAKDAAAIKECAAKKGINLMLMEPCDVKGPEAHPVFNFFEVMGKNYGVEIEKDFGIFYLVTPDGHIEIHHDPKPMDMKGSIADQMDEL